MLHLRWISLTASMAALAAAGVVLQPQLPAPAPESLHLKGAAAAQSLAPGGRLAALGPVLSRARYAVRPVEDAAPHFLAANERQQLAVGFTQGGVEFLPNGDQPKTRSWKASLRTRAVGRAGALLSAPAPVITSREDRVEYDYRLPHGPQVTEWWVNRPDGLEQGWTVHSREAAAGETRPLTVALSVAGDLSPAVAADGQSVELRGETGQPVLRGDGLKAWDATGRALPVRMALAGDTPSQLHVTVSDTDAVYPVTIDPTWTQVTKLTHPDGAAGSLYTANVVALDGDTAIISAHNDPAVYGGNTILQAGAAYVFTRVGGTWTYTQRLAEEEADAREFENFGYGLDVDGDTLVVGCINEVQVPNKCGGAYVYTRSGGTWTLQQRVIPGDPGNQDSFGWSVSLDGDNLLVGARWKDQDFINANTGAAYVFTRSGGTWTQQQKLTAPDGQRQADDNFGWAVGLSGDTAIITANQDDPVVGGSSRFNAGSAYVYVRNAGVWALQQQLTQPDGDASFSDNFGWSVALDGDTALVGAPDDSPVVGGTTLNYHGAVTVFHRTGGVWTQEAKLTQPEDDAFAGERFGYAVALEGDRALIAANNDRRSIGGSNVFGVGAANVFDRSAGVWSSSAKLAEADADVAANDTFGTSVGLSGDTALIAISQDNVTFGGTTVNDAGSAAFFSVAGVSNQSPSAVEDTRSYAIGSPLVVAAPGVLGNDSDPDGDPLQAVLVAQPAYGTVNLAADGGFTYTPLAGHPLNTSFTYRAIDPSSGESEITTVHLNVSNGPTLVAPAAVTTGKPLTVQWTAPAAQPAADWIGFYRTDVPGPSGYISWIFTNGQTTGSYTVTAPAAGTYVFRYYLNNGGLLAAVSNTVTVSDPPASEYTLTISPASVAPGGTYTVSWTAPTGRPSKDWIGIFAGGNAGPGGYLTWFYTGGSVTGSRSFTAPTTAGDYVARYYLNDGGTLGTTSNALTVTAPNSPTVTAGATTAVTGGTLPLSWTAPAGRPAKDWVALVRADQYQAGPPQVVTGYVKWAYTGGTTSGTVSFSLAGVAPGTYYAVYLLNDTYTVGAVSSAVTVTP